MRRFCVASRRLVEETIGQGWVGNAMSLGLVRDAIGRGLAEDAIKRDQLGKRPNGLLF